MGQVAAWAVARGRTCRHDAVGMLILLVRTTSSLPSESRALFQPKSVVHNAAHLSVHRGAGSSFPLCRKAVAGGPEASSASPGGAARLSASSFIADGDVQGSSTARLKQAAAADAGLEDVRGVSLAPRDVRSIHTSLRTCQCLTLTYNHHHCSGRRLVVDGIVDKPGGHSRGVRVASPYS